MSTHTKPEGPVGQFAYLARAGKEFATQPGEAFERTLEKIAEWRDERAGSFRYPVVEQADQRVHELIGGGWPCDEAQAFSAVWADALNDLGTQASRIGRGAFGGWDDGDPRLVSFAWCCARHLRPLRVLETGVGRGLTTRVLLEAMHRNGQGHLWSIDLPPLLEHGLAAETAVAVPARLRDRWTLVTGSSRRVLPSLVSQLGTIDVFIHDSMHTTRNVMFELEHVWPALAPGGVILIDDVEKNGAVSQLAKRHPDAQPIICASDDGEALIGCVRKIRPLAGSGVRPYPFGQHLPGDPFGKHDGQYRA